MTFDRDAAAFQRGIDLVLEPSKASAEANTRHTHQSPSAGPENAARSVPEFLQGNTPEDHFITRHGRVFAGHHLIIDLWGAQHLDDIDHVDATLRRCVEAAGATLLHMHLHPFQPTGVSGVAVLAESHISIHTWPERDYAALDVFMCGDADPFAGVEVLREGFAPRQVDVETLYRGEVAGRTRSERG
jgi:S-adenosylmethionine decarboxylase